ncbi:XDD4 family exosortase-dependent surface protein [Bryobacter aggregatus]|uniref:XDD4 family exosortase-dependent surface protein n=1 Tax=Bryobacter aggregatus TaxID=360054 RepID=UPI0012BB053A
MVPGILRAGVFMSKFLAHFGLVLLASSLSQATTITFTGTGTGSSSGLPLSASLTFEQVASQLLVTLTNNNPVKVPSDILIAVFFDIQPSLFSGATLNPAFIYQSAVTAPGSCLTGSTCPPPVDVKSNGEWQFKATAAGLNPGGSGVNQVNQQFGLSTAGLGIFSTPGGQQFNYGLANGLAAGSNPTVNGATLINNSLLVTFALPVGFDLATSTISNIRFQYGTSLDEGSFYGTPSVPEPSTTVLLSSGVLLVSLLRSRFRTIA